jgi:hypothetical protein
MVAVTAGVWAAFTLVSCDRIPGAGTREELDSLRTELADLRAALDTVDNRAGISRDEVFTILRDSLAKVDGDRRGEFQYAVSVLSGRVDSLATEISRVRRIAAGRSAGGITEQQVAAIIERTVRNSETTTGGQTVEYVRDTPGLGEPKSYAVMPESPAGMSGAAQTSAGILVGAIQAGRNGRGILDGSSAGVRVRASVHWKDFGGNQNVFLTDDAFVLPVAAGNGWRVSAMQWDGRVDAKVYWFPFD